MSQRVREKETTSTDEQTDEQETTDVVIPTKTVDRSLSLQDRMTDNAWYAIGPARYFERNSEGEEIEDWNGVFDRVASNIADAEYQFGQDERVRDNWKTAFERAMRELRFIPNSPTLMNAGLPLQQLSACIAGDAPVYTEDGLTKMANIDVGDRVLTHTGKFKEVTAHWSNGTKDTIDMVRGTSKSSHYDVTATPDHKVLNTDGEWVRADTVENPAQPTISPSEQFPQMIDLTQYTDVMNKEKSVTSDGGSVVVENGDDPRTGNVDQQYSRVTAHVVNDSTLAWIAGMYLAEGDIDGTDTRFTIGSHETELREKLVSTLESTFDTHVAVSESSVGEWVTITVSSPFIADMFRTVFGAGVSEKSVPSWVFAGSDTYQQSLLDGILAGDGHKSDTGWKLTLANPDLVYEASLLARNLGYDTNFKLDAQNELSSRQTSSVYISTSERTALKNVERTSGETQEVFDMEVAGDHSFVVGDFVVHNCFVVEPRDDMDDINESQSDASAIFKCLNDTARVTVDSRGSIPISDVQVGDTVVKEDGSSGDVTETHTYQDAPVHTVTLENGTTITGTPNHELFSYGEPVRIDELDNGDTLTLSLNWFEDTGPVSLSSVPDTLWETTNNDALHDAIRRGVDAGKSDYEIATQVSYSASTVQRHRKDVLEIDAVHDSGASYDGGYETGVTAGGYNDIAQPASLTDDLAWLLGLWVGDGSYHEDGIRFHLSSASVIERVEDVVASLFDTDVSRIEDDGCEEVGIYSSAIKRYWQENFNDAKPDGSQSASVPRKIWSGDRSHAISFLRGVFDADGTVIRGNYPSLTTTSQDLSQDVQQLLHGLGIEATVWYDQNRDGQMQVRPVSGSIDRFFDTIGCDDVYTIDRTITDTAPVETAVSAVESVTESGTDTVYDITVADGHEYVASSVRSHNSGGGVGYAFHHLRPKGSRVASTGGVSSGPLSFMQLFDTTCETVKQGGKRRGAQMGIMHCQHPDIGRFAVAKRGEDNLSNFNISFGITDDFTESVQNDEMLTLYDPTTRPSEQHDLRDGEPFKVVPESAHFYDPQWEDAWNDEFDKPGMGLDGKPVETNFWRDYADDMATDFSEWRDQIDLELGEPLELPAGFLWQLLIDGAWNNGEPGIFNLDETNREHSFDVDEHQEHRVHATNPCVTGDTLVYTDSGPVPAEDLYESGTATDVVVDSRLDNDTVKEASSVYKTGTKDVYKLTTDEGYEIRLTADHQIMTDDGWVETQNLSQGDGVHILSNEGSFGSHGSYELGATIGWLVGDGHLKHGEERAVLNFYEDDEHLSEKFAEYVNDVVRDPIGNGDYNIGVSNVSRNGLVEQRVRSMRLYEMAETLGLTESKHTVPDTIFTGSKDQARGFISALFGADGHVEGDSDSGLSARVTSVDRSMLQDVQRLLLQFGIQSTIYEMNDGGPTEMPDGSGGTATYNTQDTYRLCISADSLTVFATEIGFEHERKQESLESELDSYTRGPYSKSFTATVAEIEHDGVEDVYDLTEPDTSSFIANGFVVHNCSEQPLEEYEACNLGHVNLSLMKDQKAPQFDEFKKRFPDKSDGELVNAYLNRALDTQTFEDTIQTGVRFLDNVVTQSEFPLDEISEQVRGKRKVGLGLMGFHQMIVQMGVEYGSDVSYEFAREIMRRIDQTATEYSHELAKVRGPFDEWEESKWAQPNEYAEWFETHAHKQPREVDDAGYLMRNHNVTTIAPTGTTSMIGNTTGGCEPLFQVAFLKNVGDDIQGDQNLVEFDDFFLRTLEANDVNVDDVKDEVREQMVSEEKTFEGADSLETVPDEIGDLFVTTGDLSGEQHIRMQAAFQEYCDSGISKTLNLPNSATYDDVSDAFMTALDMGIKGTTVYRTGSRKKEVKKENVDNYMEETLDEVADEELVQHLVDQRNLSVKAESELRDDLGVYPDDEEVVRSCPDCESENINLGETCPFCPECGWSKCA